MAVTDSLESFGSLREPFVPCDDDNNIVFLYPPEAEGIFMPEAYAAQQSAYNRMPMYDVRVVKRTSLGQPYSTARASFYEEEVLFSDGAVRTVTLGMPNERFFGEDGVSPYPISGTDAWTTGPDGFNETVIRGLAERGYYVFWLHHQGPHAEIPTSVAGLRRALHFLRHKSVGRSAAHQHALFDDLSPHVPVETGIILGVGDSRGAMTGEAVEARAPQHDRQVAYGDYIDPCFAEPFRPENTGKLIVSLLAELGALGRCGLKLACKAFHEGEFEELLSYLGTFDPDPRNIVHEAAWLVPLLNGDSGRYAQAVPLDSVGVRTFMLNSGWSQSHKWHQIHAPRPGIKFLYASGRHVNLADPEVQQARYDRFDRLLEQMREHNFHLPSVGFNYVISGAAREL